MIITLEKTDEREIILAKLYNQEIPNIILIGNSSLTKWWVERLGIQKGGVEYSENSEKDVKDFIDFLEGEKNKREKASDKKFFQNWIDFFTDLLKKTDWTKNKLKFCNIPPL